MDRKSGTNYLEIARNVARRALPAEHAKLRAMEFLHQCLDSANVEKGRGAGTALAENRGSDTASAAARSDRSD